MEMSVGTIVTIVLLVSVLILGIFLVQKIFSSATGVVDLTDQQLKSEVNKLFSEDKKVVIYPSTRLLEIKQEATDGIGIGIKNLLEGVSGSQTFSYEVKLIEGTEKCGITEAQILNWITVGSKEADIPIPVGELISRKVMFTIPTGSPLCTVRFRVDVSTGTTAYWSEFFDVKVRAK